MSINEAITLTKERYPTHSIQDFKEEVGEFNDRFRYTWISEEEKIDLKNEN